MVNLLYYNGYSGEVSLKCLPKDGIEGFLKFKLKLIY